MIKLVYGIKLHYNGKITTVFDLNFSLYWIGGN